MGDEKSGVYLPVYPDPSASVYKPHIPFWGNIPNGLRVGKIIEIRGFIPNGANVFDINLMNYRDEGANVSDRPLHISIRPNEKIAVRNILQNGKWGSEERNGVFPFAFDTQFLLLILVETNGYRIAVDCKHRWEFQHRIPFVNVTMLHIDGTVRIDEIRYRDPYLDRLTSPHGDNQPQSCVLKPVMNPPIPYFYPIPDGLKAGQMIFISARPNASAKRFTINLICSRSPYPPPDDIAFHFDSRMYCSTLVRNTCVNGKWGKEETTIPFFPFIQGVYFDMIIRIENGKVMVAVNGQHFLEYRHRIFPLLKVNTLNVTGEIAISAIRFC